MAIIFLASLTLCSSHAEKNYEDVTQHDQTNLVGLCSGLFAAAAIASTPSLSALVPVAVQVVLMAFRTGSYVHRLAERLNPAVEQSESWTYIFPGLKAEEARHVLEEFHSSNVSDRRAEHSREQSSNSLQIRAHHKLQEHGSAPLLPAASPFQALPRHWQPLSAATTCQPGRHQSRCMGPTTPPTSTPPSTSTRFFGWTTPRSQTPSTTRGRDPRSCPARLALGSRQTTRSR